MNFRQLQSLLNRGRALLRALGMDITRSSLYVAMAYLLVREVQAGQRANETAAQADASLVELDSFEPAVQAQDAASQDAQELAGESTQTPALDPEQARAELRALIEQEIAKAQSRDQATQSSQPAEPEAPSTASVAPEAPAENAGQSGADTNVAQPKSEPGSDVSVGSVSFNPFGLLALLGLGGGGGGGGGGLPGQIIQYASGIVADGYIAGALVTLYDSEGRVLGTTRTDADGNYQFEQALLDRAARIVATGGTDVSTGLPFTLELQAPATATVVNPLTTLVQAFIDSNPDLSPEEAAAQVAEKLGIPPGLDLLTVDPIAAAQGGGALAEVALQTQILAAQVANLLVTGVALLTEAGADPDAALAALLDNVVTQLANAESIDLTDEGQLTDILAGDAVAALVDPDALVALQEQVASLAEVMAVTNAITDISLDELYELQKVIQGDLTDAIESGADLGSVTDSILEDVSQVTNSPTLSVVAGAAVVEGSAAVGQLVATYSANGQGVVVGFTAPTAYYELGVGADAGKVFLTEAGADWVNAGKALPAVALTATAAGQTVQNSAALVTTLVNDAPTGTDGTVTVVEDGSKTLSTSDFGFKDATGETGSLSAVIITSLPGAGAGTLTLSGQAVTVNQSILVADLNAGSLVFTPEENASGNAYATIGFKVVDNGGTANGGQNTSATANTLTINVTAVNDAPVIESVSISGTAEEGATLTAEVTTSDEDGDSLELSYQWLVSDTVDGTYTAIEGATGQTYTIAADGTDNDKFFKVEVTASDGVAADVQATSAASAQVANVNDTPNIAVTAVDYLPIASELVAGSVIGRYVVSDEETATSSLQVGFTNGAPTDANSAPLYSIVSDGTVVLTAAGAAYANAGGDLPEFSLTVIDGVGEDAESAEASANPEFSGDTIDLPGEQSITIELVQAQALIAAGLHFAENDTITLDLPVEGTYLANKLSAASLTPAALGNAEGGLGVDVLDIGGALVESSVHLNAASALAVGANGMTFADNDSVILDLNADNIEGTYFGQKLSNAGAPLGVTLGISDLGNEFDGLGIDVIDLQGSNAVTLSETDALALIDAGMSFAVNDQITLDLVSEGTYLSNKLAAAGLAAVELGDLQGGVGVDVLDIGGADVSAELRLTAFDALSVGSNGMVFADNDSVILDLNADNIEGTYFGQKLSNAGAQLGVTLGIADLGNGADGLGIDVIDLQGNNAVTLSETDALALIDAGMSFAVNDQITLDLVSEGTYLSNKLGAAGLTAAGLGNDGGVGVDVLDIGGAGVYTSVRLSENDALSAGENEMVFAGNDSVILDLDLAGVEGTYLGQKLANGGVGGYMGASIADVGNGFDGLGVDVIDLGGAAISDALRLSADDAQALISNGLTLAADDQVTLEVDSTYVTGRMTGEGFAPLGQMGVDVVEVSRGESALAGLNLDISGGVQIDLADALGLMQLGMPFAAGDTVTLNIDNVQGTYLSNQLGHLGVSEAALGNADGGLGVDVLDVGGADVSNAVRMDEASFTALIDAGLSLAANDTVTLEVDATFMAARMGTSGVAPLGQMGIDQVEISRAGQALAGLDLDISGSVQIGADDALGLISQGLQFAYNDDVALNINLAGDDVAGTYLGSKLAAANLSLADLGKAEGGLGVDVIDVSGAQSSSVALSGTDMLALIDNNLSLAANDIVTLDVQTTFMAGRMDTVGVGALGNLGVDHIDIANGVQPVATLDLGAHGGVQIDTTDALGLIQAGLSFAYADTVTLDATGLGDAHALGSFLSTHVDQHPEMSALAALGVDSVVVLKEVLGQTLSEEPDLIDLWTQQITPEMPGLKVAVDSLPSSGESAGVAVQMAAEIQEIVGDLLQAGVAFDSQASMGDLLSALEGAMAGNLDQAFDAPMLQAIPVVDSFVAQADDHVVMSDELARALADAGMFEAVPQARVEIDAGANPVLQTPFALLAEFGVDKVTSSQDTVYMQLGSVSDLQEMAGMIESLLTGTEGQPLFHHSGDNAEIPGALLLDASHSALIDGLLSKDAVAIIESLQALGVEQIDLQHGVVPQNQIADIATPVTLLGTGYESIDLQKLLDKHSGS